MSRSSYEYMLIIEWAEMIIDMDLQKAMTLCNYLVLIVKINTFIIGINLHISARKLGKANFTIF